MKRKRSFRRLLRSAAAGEEITIASRGVPVACLVPVHTQKFMRKLGVYGDTIKIADDFDARLPSAILDALEGLRRRRRK